MMVSERLSTPARNFSTCQHDLCRLTRENMITPSLWDGLLSLTYSWHFVPGYSRTVPPGRGRQTAIKLTLMGSSPGLTSVTAAR